MLVKLLYKSNLINLMLFLILDLQTSGSIQFNVKMKDVLIINNMITLNLINIKMDIKHYMSNSVLVN